MTGRGVADRLGEARRIVAQDAEIGGLRAEPLQHAEQEIAVGVVEARRPAAACPARRFRRRSKTARRGRAGVPLRRSRPTAAASATSAGSNRRPAGNRKLAGRDILPGEPAIGARLQSGRHDDVAAVERAIFLHVDGVGARRHRRAGENADRLARPERTRAPCAGGDARRTLSARLRPRRRCRHGARHSRRPRNCRTAESASARRRRRRARGRAPAPAAAFRFR